MGVRAVALRFPIGVKRKSSNALLEPEELESIVKICMEEIIEEYGCLPNNVSLDEMD